MPVRARRRRQPRTALTLARFMALCLGPDTQEVDEELAAVYREHRRRFDRRTWAHRYFVEGVDDRPPDDPDAAQIDDTDAVLPGTDAYRQRIAADVA